MGDGKWGGLLCRKYGLENESFFFFNFLDLKAA